MAAAIAYILTIFGANLLIRTVGFIPVGFGLVAPAGVLCVGLSFTLRDFVQEAYGKAWTIGCVLVGAACSALLSPALALASGGAFLASELSDLLVYTPLRRRNWLGAVALSNTVGLAVDSVLFLYLAFGSLDFLAGQVVAKGYMTLLAVAVLYVVRRRRAVLPGDAPARLAGAR
jgi:uncharacterized PurR-regulated membrane protein YhhQ (DUF165 family)